MLSALVGFVIAAVIIGLVAWVLILLWDWVCGQIGIPGPIPQIVRVVIIVVAVVAILYRLMPLAGRI